MSCIARRLVAVCALMIAITAVSPTGAAAFEPRVPESFFGISDPDLWTLTEQGRLAQRDAQLQGIKAAGLDWVRTEIGWREIEPNAPQNGVHSYNWSLADNYVTALSHEGLRLFPMLMPAPVWALDPSAAAASCGRRGAVAPDRAGDYGDFAAALVRRYGADGTFWTSHSNLTPQPVTRVELWNEPNFRGFWCPAPDPETFASLMRQGADSIHAADPSVEVVLGGLAAFKNSQSDGGGLVAIGAGEFLERMLAQDPDLASRVQVVGFHPYESDANKDLSLIDWFRKQMNDAGLGTAEIALTEFGWHRGTAQWALSEDQRTQNYLEFTDQIPRTNCGITGVAAHTWETAELDPSNPEDWWGIASPSTGELYPSGQAYRDEVALYEGRGPAPAPSETIDLCGGSPDTQITSGPAASVPTDTVRFEFTSDDSTAAFWCNLDYQSWQPCSSPRDYGGLADGAQAFQVVAVDRFGHVDPSPASQTFEVHVDPGIVSIDSGPDQGELVGPTPTFAFSAPYASSYECRFDAGTFAPCSPSGTAPAAPLAGGKHLFEVRGIGGSGKIGASTVRNFSVDTTPPEIKVFVAGRTARINTATPTRIPRRSVSFRFVATDSSPLRSYRCKLDDHAWHACRPRLRLRHLSYGRHVLRVRIGDKWGNRATAAAAWRVVPRS